MKERKKERKKCSITTVWIKGELNERKKKEKEKRKEKKEKENRKIKQKIQERKKERKKDRKKIPKNDKERKKERNGNCKRRKNENILMAERKTIQKRKRKR